LVAYEHCARVNPSPLPKLMAAEPGPITLAGVQLFARGAVLRPRQKPSPGRLKLGVLGDTRQALPATLARLRHLAKQMKRLGAQAIIVLGGIDSTFEGIRDVLAQLSPKLPVLALPGDRESRSGFSGAAVNVGQQVVDLILVKALVLPGASLVGVPGYHLPHHLMAAEQGCSYDWADLQALVSLARELPGPRVLLAHGPPRGAGPHAVDRAFGDINIGDPLLGRLLQQGQFAFGLFSHVHESAGRATTLKGEPVAENQWSTSLLLNVGAVDTVPNQDLQGRWSRGTAALVEVEDRRARYRMIRWDHSVEKSH